MKKIVITLAAVFLFSLNNVNAQSKGTFTYGIGATCLADVVVSPFYYEKDFNPNDTWQGYYPSGKSYFNSEDTYSKSVSISLFSYSFHLNTKLYQINDNASVSLNVAPNLRLGVDKMGAVCFNAPITLNYNRGVLSTFDSDKEKGFYIGAGAIIQTTPLIKSINVRGNKEYDYGTHVYVQPCIQTGLRYWGKDSKVAEISLQVGYLDFKDFTTYVTASDINGNGYYAPSEVKKNTAVSAKLTFIKYINY